jgi:hypothetical protein
MFNIRTWSTVTRPKVDIIYCVSNITIHVFPLQTRTVISRIVAELTYQSCGCANNAHGRCNHDTKMTIDTGSLVQSEYIIAY